MISYIFPGQGSQRIGMGEGLFSNYPDYIEKANNILDYDIEELCINGPMNKLSQTEYTQPALYVYESLNYLDKIKTAAKPDFLAGHSLGEYVALFAAEVFDFETGLKLVKKRGELMAQQQGGAMAAVLNLNVNELKQILETHDYNLIELANLNSPMQTVVSGASDQVNDFVEKSTDLGITVVPLFVSAAFHSSHMQPMQEEYAEFLQDFDFNAPKLAVIANFDAQPYADDNIRTKLINQLTNPVQWHKIINYMLDHGVNEFVEVGMGDILTRLVKEIESHR